MADQRELGPAVDASPLLVQAYGLARAQEFGSGGGGGGGASAVEAHWLQFTLQQIDAKLSRLEATVQHVAEQAAAAASAANFAVVTANALLNTVGLRLNPQNGGVATPAAVAGGAVGRDHHHDMMGEHNAAGPGRQSDAPGGSGGSVHVLPHFLGLALQNPGVLPTVAAMGSGEAVVQPLLVHGGGGPETDDTGTGSGGDDGGGGLEGTATTEPHGSFRRPRKRSKIHRKSDGDGLAGGDVNNVVAQSLLDHHQHHHHSDGAGGVGSGDGGNIPRHLTIEPAHAASPQPVAAVGKARGTQSWVWGGKHWPEGIDKFLLNPDPQTIHEVWSEYMHCGPDGKPPLAAIQYRYGKRWVPMPNTKAGKNCRKHLWSARNEWIILEFYAKLGERAQQANVQARVLQEMEDRRKECKSLAKYRDQVRDEFKLNLERRHNAKQRMIQARQDLGISLQYHA
eukprot:SM000076S21859  [mRNA]  locus=s76:495804:498069:- [translate_table: standard]